MSARYAAAFEPADLAAVKISVEEEQRLGNLAARAFVAYLASQRIRVTEQGRDVDYLRKMVDGVRPYMTHADRYSRPTIYLVHSPRFDARVFPGGHMFFFRGLLESIGSEAALVGVIGHELAHLDRGHALSRLRQMKLIAKTARGDWRDMTGQQRLAVRDSIARIWMRPVEPQSEAQADRDGARWAYQAGYDPREMGRLVLRPHNGEANQQLPGVSFSPPHASREDRHQAIFQEYERLQEAAPNAALYIGKGNPQRRAFRPES
ncbi:MAG: M48 family metalloprotease [Pirellulales bacterium]|nr:M48 family metalloprotease [Pirellulales bacterium]